MASKTGEEPNNNPVVVASMVAMALAAFLILGYNLFVRPERATELNPIGKQGARSAAPVNAPDGGLKNGASGTTP